jgi:hypothetical protein
MPGADIHCDVRGRPMAMRGGNVGTGMNESQQGGEGKESSKREGEKERELERETPLKEHTVTM